MRETLADALKRITAVVLVGADKHDVSASINKPLIHAHLKVRLPDAFPTGEKFLAFSGIARPEKFFATCRETRLQLIDTMTFADHHPFSDLELNQLQEKAKQANAKLLTTAKDWVRLPDAFRRQTLVLPVEMIIEGNGFLEILLQSSTTAERTPS